MNNFRAAILMSLLAAFGQPVVGQGTHQILPVSPEAAALAKMVNYPINHNTGIPNINIPLHEIRVDGLELPIALQYHAGGFRINEQATRVGLGWSLSSDLQITRTVNGLDDFKAQVGYLANTMVKGKDTIPYFDNAAYPLWSDNPAPYRHAYDLAVGDKDGMPDKFNYRLLNKSGSFYFQKDYTGSGYTIVTVPYDNVKITWDNGRFVVRDTDGTTYYFGEEGSANGNQLAAMGNELSGVVGYGNCDCVRSTWKCKRIVNSMGTGEINFEYEAKTTVWRRYYQDKIEHYNNPVAPVSSRPYYRSDVYPLTLSLTYQDLINNYVDPWSISSPKFKEYGPGLIRFNVPNVDMNTGQVTDKYFPIDNSVESSFIPSGVMGVSLKQITFTGGKVVFSGADRLGTITVYEGQTNRLKEISFIQSYTEPVNLTRAKVINGSNFQGTLYLDEIRVSGKQAPAVETYKLFYLDKECFGDHLKGHDVWGYRNASTMEFGALSGDVSAVPLHTINQAYYFSSTHYFSYIPFTFGSNLGQEMPIASYMKKGVISRIEYPTGGYTAFEFEANEYKVGTSTLTGGGLRVSSIRHYESSGAAAIRKHYKYGEQEDGAGVLVNPPVSNSGSNGIVDYTGFSYEQVLSYLTGPYNVPGNGTRPFYPIPANCSGRGCLNVIINETKTTYVPSSFLDFTYANGAPIYYTSVSEYREEMAQLQGKTIYKYYDPGEFYDEVVKLWPKSHVEQTNIRRLQTDGFMGMKKAEIHFKNDSGTLDTIQKTAYKYRRYLRQEMVRVVYSFQRVFFETVGGNFSGSAFNKYNQAYGFNTGNDPTPYYWADQYGIAVGKMLLTETLETSYDGPVPVTRRTEYFYDHPDYVQPSRIQVTDSKEIKKLETRYKYPYDYAGTVYQQMVTKNMVAPVIEERVMRVGSVGEISRRLTTWANIASGPGFSAPVLVEQSENGGTLYPVYSYDLYDEKANVLQVTEVGGPPTIYLWGYNGQYPVAKVANASPTNVAYAGFESAAKGNWLYSGPAVLDGTAPTGSRAYSLGGGSLQKTGLSSGRRYVLTYWAKSTSASAISGGTAAVLRAYNGWTQYRRVVTGVTAVTLSGSVRVDDVRLHPVESAMDTYTYDPLVGMTSATDASGHTVRYDYDGFGRLWRVRDHEGNPVEEYDYHYYNQ